MRIILTIEEYMIGDIQSYRDDSHLDELLTIVDTLSCDDLELALKKTTELIDVKNNSSKHYIKLLL